MAGVDYLAMVCDPEELLSIAKSIDGPVIARLLGEYQHMAQTMAEVGQFAHEADGAAAAQLFGKFVDEAHHESAVLSYAALNIADTCNRMKAKLANFYEQYVEKVQPAAQNLQQAYDAQLGHGPASSPAELRTASTALAEALGHLYTDLAGNPTVNVDPTFPAAAIPDIGADGGRAADGGGARQPRGGQGGSAALGGEHGSSGTAGAVGSVPVGSGKSNAGQDSLERASLGGAAGGALGSAGAVLGALGSAGSGLAGAASAGAGFAADAAGLGASLGGLATQASADVPFRDGIPDDADHKGKDSDHKGKIGDAAPAAATKPAADLASGASAGAGSSALADSASSRTGTPPELRQAAPTAGLGGQPVSGGAGPAVSSGMMGMPMMGAAGMAGGNAEHRVASYLITKEQGERQFTDGLPLASEEILGVLDERERLAMQIASIDDEADEDR